jgi:hypothetical protein
MRNYIRFTGRWLLRFVHIVGFPLALQTAHVNLQRGRIEIQACLGIWLQHVGIISGEVDARTEADLGCEFIASAWVATSGWPHQQLASVSRQLLQGNNDLSHHAPSNMARGKLIVFEGLDRAGKSTQCQMLVDDLQNDGIKVRHMRFPGRCKDTDSYLLMRECTWN